MQYWLATIPCGYDLVQGGPTIERDGMLTHRQMQILSAIIRHKSVTAAAQILGLSQPALSRQLKYAEDRLGYSLFIRRKGRIEPTSEALLLFDEIARTEAYIQGVQSLARELGLGQTGLLRVGTSSSLSLTIFPEAIRRFRAAYPGVKLVAHSRPIVQLEELLVAREIDYGLALTPFRIPNAAVAHLAEIPMVCIMAKNHPLCGQAVVQLEDVMEHDLISFGSDTYFGRLLDMAFKSKGLVRKVAVEVWSSMLAIPLVRSSAAIAIIDLLLARQLAHDLTIKAIEPAVSLTVTSALASGGPATRFVDRFAQCVEEALSARPQ